MTLEQLEINGECFVDLRYFIKAAKDNATFGSTAENANRKRKSKTVGTNSSKKPSVAEPAA